jgi:predicted dehydrogenase
MNGPRSPERHKSRPAGCVASSPALDRAQLTVAVVGYGSIGRRHLANLERLGVGLRLVVRRREGANPAFASPTDAAVVHSDDEAIERGIDAVIICNPTCFHVASAERYIAAGVPVLIEKPLCAVGQEAAAARLAATAPERNVTAGVAYCLRYHPAYRLAREAVAAGRLGRLRAARAWFESYLPDWHPWEDYRQTYAARAELGGGVLPTLDHEIDWLNWCLGKPEDVDAEVSTSRTLEMDVPDTARLRIIYPGDVTAEVSLSLCRRERSRGFELTGDNGTLSFSWQTGSLLLEGGPSGRRSQCLWSQGAAQPPYDVNAMYEGLLEDFVRAVQLGVEAPIPLPWGLAATRVCQLALATKGAGSHSGQVSQAL